MIYAFRFVELTKHVWMLQHLPLCCQSSAGVFVGNARSPTLITVSFSVRCAQTSLYRTIVL
jgi:hypothetical protein